MYRSKLLYLICCLICLSLVALGCSESNKTSAEESTFNPAPGGSIPPGFKVPHPDGTNAPEIHGIWANESGVSMCLKCHAVDSSSKSNTPACRSCHALFPHDNDWVKKENHGKFVLDKSDNDCKTKCHGSDLGGGLSKKSCTSCHSIYPHSQNWSNPKEHGETAKDDGKKICTPCHGDDFLGGDSKVSCYKCHDKYPHEANWTLSQKHGVVAIATPAACATECHGSDLNGGLSKKSCTSCHSIYPHSKNWSDPKEHGEKAKDDGKKVCTPCHGNDFLGGDSKVSCYKCHDKYPHGADWTLPQKHGAVAIATPAACATECHGSDLNGGLSQKSCASCHSIYPHVANWKLPEKHGVVAKTTPATCTTQCHGSDLNGGASGISCNSCHPNFPHPGGWKNYEGHGQHILETLHGDKTSCKNCHGSDFSGGTSGISCSSPSCHASYPHREGWQNYEEHGRYVLETLRGDKTSCKNCHGSDFSGGTSGISCSSCHAGYPHREGWEEGSAHGPNAYGAAKVACGTANCHGINFLGSTLAPSCSGSNCHSVYPHTNPRWMTVEPTTPNATNRDQSFHGDNFIKNWNAGTRDACTQCHGANFDREVGGVKCTATACHASGVTHRDNWANAQHGTFFSGQYNSMSTGTSCAKCHGKAVMFNNTQTAESLASQSECYSCHTAYPHKGLEDSWSPVWEPVRCLAGSSTIHHYAHMDYVWNGNPPFVNVQESCGRNSAGLCHSGGYRSYKRLGGDCGTYCHQTSQSVPTPACTPPSGDAPGTPTIVSTIPANGATGVPPSNSIITINFSKSMSSSSIRQVGNIRLYRVGGSSHRFNIECADDWCKTVIMTPRSFEGGRIYKFEISTAVTDLEGTALAESFTSQFVTLPVVPLAVERVTLVPTITITFNEAMDSQTTISAISLKDGPTATGANVPGTISCSQSSDCSKFTFTPDAPLSVRPHAYTLVVSTAATSLSGNHLSAQYTYTFYL